MAHVGRPIIPFDLNPGWQDSVLDLYKQGAADVEIKAHIYYSRGSFSNNLWDRWLEEEPEFWETIKVGRMLSEAWWTKTGREKLEWKDFSYTGWYMNMKNRFGWRDKQEIDQKTEHSGSVSFGGIQIVNPEVSLSDITKAQNIKMRGEEDSNIPA